MPDPSFQTLRLSRGKHSSPQHGACVMEVASMLAGEGFTDRPDSVSPAIGSFMRGYNDLLDDRRRQDLLRYASEVVGTAGPEALERARRKRLVAWADERWARRSLSEVFGRYGKFRTPPADPDGAGMYAVRALRNGSRREHHEALALLDELIAMGRRLRRPTWRRARPPSSELSQTGVLTAPPRRSPRSIPARWGPITAAGSEADCTPASKICQRVSKLPASSATPAPAAADRESRPWRRSSSAPASIQARRAQSSFPATPSRYARACSPTARSMIRCAPISQATPPSARRRAGAACSVGVG